MATHAEPDILTVEEAAEYLRVSPSTVRRMARTGLLPGVRIGRQWRFSRRQLLEWVEEAAIPEEMVELGMAEAIGERLSERNELFSWEETKERLGL